MRLKRGHIFLIAGGVLIAVGLFASGYYGEQVLEDMQKHTIQPNSYVQIVQNIPAGSGLYIVAIPEFESNSQPAVKVTDPSGETLVQKTVQAPFVSEPFSAATAGNYTLTITNMSQDTVLDASGIIGDQQAIESVLGTSFLISSALLVLFFASGVVVAAIGVVLTVLDARKAKNMKQFGDVSDLR